MVELLEYMDKPTLHSFTIVSSKYCTIAQPLIFRRICVDRTAYKRFVLFIEQMETSSKLALMIKILIILKRSTINLLPRLFAVVSNVEELFIDFVVAESLLTPHYFPNLRRLHFPVSRERVLQDLVTNFIPLHESLNDLEFPFVPYGHSDIFGVLHMPLLAESASSWVNRLITYHGPRGLLSLLTPNSMMKHLTSSQQLDEAALRELSRVVSNGLLSLIIDDPIDRTAAQTLPPSLLPTLFPNLQSIAWLPLYTNTGALDPIMDIVGEVHISCLRQLTLKLQDKNTLTLRAIDQLPLLRQIWFSSNHTGALPKDVATFMAEIQEGSDNKNRPLHAIYVYASAGFPISHIYTKASIHSGWTLALQSIESNHFSVESHTGVLYRLPIYAVQPPGINLVFQRVSTTRFTYWLITQ
jgi:hypothetical protein